MKIETMYKRLEKTGVQLKYIMLTGNRKAICCSHNYEGPYPARETWEIIEAIRRTVRNTGYIAEDRGFHTATFVYKEA